MFQTHCVSISTRFFFEPPIFYITPLDVVTKISRLKTDRLFTNFDFFEQGLQFSLNTHYFRFRLHRTDMKLIANKKAIPNRYGF